MDQQADRFEWDFDRRFGVEIEVNAFDGKSRPDSRDDTPVGMTHVATVVQQTLDTAVQITRHGYNHDNMQWVVKPDGSCGMEVCSPVLKGWIGLETVLKVIEAFAADPRIQSDSRCSFHVHVNVADLARPQIGNVVANWIKCEPVFLDAMPAARKRSRYCQVIGMCDLFDNRERLTAESILERTGRVKYFTMNNVHYSKGNRKTVEYRIADHEFCMNAFHAKNWVKLVVLFTEMAARRDFAGTYNPTNPFSGLSWLDPKDVVNMMGLMPLSHLSNLSDGMIQTRNWFLGRMEKHMLGSAMSGLFSDEGRSFAHKELCEIIKEVARRGEWSADDPLNPPNMKEDLYGSRYRK